MPRPYTPNRFVGVGHARPSAPNQPPGYTFVMEFRVVLEFDAEAQSWSAVCPELPGCTSVGTTAEEAQSGIEEAVRLYLAADY
jgi:predicted RNase H-like HicB family nuclease